MLSRLAPIRPFLHMTARRALSTTTTTSNSTTHFGFETIPAHEKESKVASVFTNVASSYDAMNDAMSFGVHRLWKDAFTARCGLGASIDVIRSHNSDPGTTSPITLDVLDVAGGTGDISFRFVDDLKMEQHSHSSSTPDCCSVTVCDINRGMLDVGIERATKRYGQTLLSTKKLTFVEGNAEKLPFDDNSFDLYTISFGLRNVTNIPRALEEAHRVLKPGGRFLCCEFSQPVNNTFREVYDFYSFNLIPKMGEAIANDKDSYQYLVESIRKFYKQDELVEEITKAGFLNASYENYTGGVVAFHEGWKL